MNNRRFWLELTRTVRPVALAAAAATLAGCVGGTTYGTGVSQEKQTLDGFYNMLSLKTERKNIDYSARPDLVVPENKDVLPEPVEVGAATADPQWPETPEQRIVRIRAQAGEVDARTCEVSIEEQLRRKEGIAIETGEGANKFIPGATDREGNPVLYRGQSEARKQVISAKADLAPARGVNRKYLTEPPVAYRVPADTAPAGVSAYSEQELALRAEEQRKRAEEERKDPLRKQ